MTIQTTSDDETSPLLGHQRTESNQTLVSDETTQKTDDKKASGGNIVWILAAVWSAVFLGALDGTSPAQRFQLDTTSMQHRNHCRDPTLPNRRILQSVASIVLHWHLVFAVRVLLHAVIRETIGYPWT